MAAKGEKSSAKKIAAYMRARGITRTMGRCGACYASVSIPNDRHTCSLKTSGSAAYRRMQAAKAAKAA